LFPFISFLFSFLIYSTRSYTEVSGFASIYRWQTTSVTTVSTHALFVLKGGLNNAPLEKAKLLLTTSVQSDESAPREEIMSLKGEIMRSSVITSDMVSRVDSFDQESTSLPLYPVSSGVIERTSIFVTQSMSSKRTQLMSRKASLRRVTSVRSHHMSTKFSLILQTLNRVQETSIKMVDMSQPISELNTNDNDHVYAVISESEVNTYDMTTGWKAYPIPYHSIWRW
jgi:hypothetical protein